MKTKNIVMLIFSFLALAHTSISAQSEARSHKTNAKSVLVTIECESCTKRNKFKISGPENHVFIRAQFPIEQILAPGEYEMTYWQNKVQQIHLPFSVNPETKNVIVVKD